MTLRLVGRHYATRLLLLVVVVAGVVVVHAAKPNPSARKVQILNNSGRRVEVSWIHPQTKALTVMSQPDVLTGTSMSIDSFITHSFEIKELPAKSTGTCRDESLCQKGIFTVNANEDQVVQVDRNFVLTHEDRTTVARRQASALVDGCHDAIQKAIAADPTIDVFTKFSECVAPSITKKLLEAADELAFQAQVRTDFGKRYENYTCMDHDLDSSKPIRIDEWVDPSLGNTHTVQIMVDRPASRIHVIESFITPVECEAIETAANPNLKRAAVADGAGGITYSPNRKAMQAGLDVPWDEEEDGHPIATLSRKVYDYANHVLGFGIQEHGQEPLMSIQYFGKGDNISTTEYDQYMPHCDGECTGDAHKPGTRMATMVMYCEVPEKGGATNFRNSGIHIRATKGNGIFFSYINPETRTMDAGFTEHSGCPVVEGEKKIVTQWIRLGVDKENPWTSYNSLGLKIVPETADDGEPHASDEPNSGEE